MTMTPQSNYAAARAAAEREYERECAKAGMCRTHREREVAYERADARRLDMLVAAIIDLDAALSQ